MTGLLIQLLSRLSLVLDGTAQLRLDGRLQRDPAWPQKADYAFG
jgi:hypothetical protein